MSRPFLRPVVLDATVLSNYASTDSVSWLTSAFEGLWTVPAVVAELRRGIDHGYEYLSGPLEAVDRGQISVEESAPGNLERASPDVRDRLDPGEAEALVAADHSGGTLVTDDGTARSLASKREIALTGSIGLLVRGIVCGELPVERADRWLSTWMDERSYYAPVDSVRDVLPDDYSNNCNG